MSSSTSQVASHDGELPVETTGLKKKRAAGKAESSRQSKRPKTETKADAVPKASVKISRGRTNARARPPAPVEEVKVEHLDLIPEKKAKAKWGPPSFDRLANELADGSSAVPCEVLPRMWTSSREELVAVLPESTKFINGLSWAHFETPLLLLDKQNHAMRISKTTESEMGFETISFDLTTTRTFTLKAGINAERPSVPDPRSEDVRALSAIGDTRVISNPGDSFQKENTTATPENVLPLSRKVVDTVAAAITQAPDDPSQPLQSPIMKIQLPQYAVPPPPLPTTRTLRSRQRSNRPASTRTPRVVSTPEKVLQLSADVAATSAPSSVAPLTESSREATSQGTTDGKTPVAFFGSDDLATCSTGGEAPLDVPHIRQEEQENGVTVLSPLTGPSTTRNTPPPVEDAPSSKLTPPELAQGSLAPSPLGEPSALSPRIDDILQCDTVIRDLTATSSSEPTDGVEVPLNPDPLGSQTASGTVHSSSTNDLRASEDNFDSLVPEDFPEEIQAIIDAYLRGKPIGIMMSNERLRIDWSLSLDEEYGYVSMGWFRVVGVQEIRTPLLDGPFSSRTKQGDLCGRVQWKFRLRWAPGGEEWHLAPQDLRTFEYPWWIKYGSKPEQFPLPLETVSGEAKEANVELEAEFQTTPKYWHERQRSSSFRTRHFHPREMWTSILPMSLVAGTFGPGYSDAYFPRGWVCESCGRINFQSSLRRRRCPSKPCEKKDDLVKPYSVDPLSSRDLYDSCPVYEPANIVPCKPVDTRSPDDMRTLTYTLGNGSCIKHVSTLNQRELQERATWLLQSFQTDVDLKRTCGGNSPYFHYKAVCPGGTTDASNDEWPEVPAPINEAKTWILQQVEQYAKAEEPPLLKELSVFAWIKAGSKAAPDSIRAKTTPVLLFALGLKATLTITPRCSNTAGKKASGRTKRSQQQASDDAEVGNTWTSSALDEEQDGTAVAPRQTRMVGNKKVPAHAFVITLYHGDTLVLYGDDFDWHIKREDMSIVLIAS